MNRKTIAAGPMIRKVQYPTACGRLTSEVRAGRKQATSAAMKRINLRYSYQKFEAILAANFSRGSNVVTLTYDDNNYPEKNGRKRVTADVKRLRHRLTEEWQRSGAEMRMAWAIESKHGDGRWHVHAVISRRTGNDLPTIQSCWGYGSVNAKHLREDRDRNHMSLARYMTKEAPDAPNSAHCWHVTKNCVRPTVTIERGVPDTEMLTAPAGAMVLDCESHTTDYGTWQYLTYYIPDDAREGSGENQ